MSNAGINVRRKLECQKWKLKTEYECDGKSKLKHVTQPFSISTTL